MNRSELITEAILDHFGSGVKIYSSKDILDAAGIDEEKAKEIQHQLSRTINQNIRLQNS